MSLSLLERLILFQIKGMGYYTLDQLVKTGSDFESLKMWSAKDWYQVKRLPHQNMPDLLKSILSDKELIDRLSVTLESADFVVSIWDTDYPPLLKEIHSPPPFLFCRGSHSTFKKNCFAIVGTRFTSHYGRVQAAHFTELIVQQNLIPVSGLARGIDTIVHRKCVEFKHPTIAVIGTGLDSCYPKENVRLVEDIVASGGLIVTEFLNQTKPDMQNFPKRNRIISGLSSGVLVIEAGLKSGALLTAEIAIEQNREVFAIPGQIDSQKSSGCHYLIKQGAKLVESISDISDEIQLPSRFTNPTTRDLSDLNQNELEIYNIITDEKHIDDISELLNKPVHHLLADLLNLEMKQFIKQIEGKRFIRLV